MTTSAPTIPAPTALLMQLRSAVSAGAVEPLDVALARWIAQRDPDRGDELATAVLLLSMARRAGHTAIRLHDMDRNDSVRELAAEVRLPSEAAIRDALESSALVGPPAADTPLVLHGDLLFLRRFWDGEQRILQAVRDRLPKDVDLDDHASLRPLVERLFPSPATGEVDWQAVAVAAALRSRFLCIAGGPGTGKTTTVVRLMAVLLEHDPELRIALAAPTGKAANRLAESVSDQVVELTLDVELKDRMPRTASTLHRLLGYRPSQARFSYGPQHRLNADVVIVDEASMIDHQLFTALVAALPDDARLVLIGDPDQLPSVDAGFVFGDLCRMGGTNGMSRELIAHARAVGIAHLPKADSELPPMADAVITLKRTYRFGPDSGIGAVARALRDGRGDHAVSAMRSPDFSDIQLIPRSEQDRRIRERVRPWAEALVGAASPAEALAQLDRLRLLSPMRVGAEGTIAMNDDIERWLLDERIRPHGDHYTGKPIIITTNDYDIGLFNGDVGVLWNAGDRLVGCFLDGDGDVREVAQNRLPPHDVAWAMTVHKSQGSEFDDVLLVLPEPDHAHRLTRELLYTAVTRARRSVTIIGDAEVVVAAAARREARVTGLGEASAATGGSGPERIH